jgi:hypothetical protein
VDVFSTDVDEVSIIIRIISNYRSLGHVKAGDCGQSCTLLVGVILLSYSTVIYFKDVLNAGRYMLMIRRDIFHFKKCLHAMHPHRSRH